MKHDAIAWFPDRREEFEAVEITPPTRVVTDTAMIDFGEKVVTMSYHGLVIPMPTSSSPSET